MADVKKEARASTTKGPVKSAGSAVKRAVAPKTAAPTKVVAKPEVAIMTKPKAAVAARPKTAVATKPKAADVAKPARTRKSKPAAIPQEQRRNYIEVAAYYIAARRGFAPGDTLQDWIDAETEIDRLLAEGRLGLPPAV